MSLTLDTTPALPAKRRAAPGSLLWFAAHESRLIWRDFASMGTDGKPTRMIAVGTVIIAFVIGMHLLSLHLLAPIVGEGLSVTKPVLLALTGTMVLFFSLMFSQAIESVTRAYYARSDLDLILSSPAPSHRLFQVRTSVLTVQTIMLSLLIATPMLNALVMLDGAHWLAGYGVLVALGALATCAAVGVTLGLFKWVGPGRTRLIAQIVAAIVGAGFIIALQAAGIMLGQGVSRMGVWMAPETLANAPALESIVWLPARAAMGDAPAWMATVLAATAILTVTIHTSARRFASDVLATSGLENVEKTARSFTGFSRTRSIAAHLRRKEWQLLARDPWLISQTLQQILYLIPPAFLLYLNAKDGTALYYVIVPVVVMAAGQLAGGLSWISISGEDAHELIITAPVKPTAVLIAKVQAVLAVIAAVLTPFLLWLAFTSPRAALFLALGGALSAGSAVLIQLWFRSQANRSLFRRRQVSSKAATICEALVSILWAAGAGLAILNVLMGIVPAVLAIMVLGFAKFMAPKTA
ncbi:MAG: permease [Pseudomonadota bacterium]